MGRRAGALPLRGASSVPAAQGAGQPVLRRGKVESVAEAAGTAVVRLKAAPVATLTVWIAEDIPVELVHVGDEVAVLLWGDVGGVITACYGTAFSWPVQGRVLETGSQTITTTAYAALVGMSLVLTIRETSYFWLWATITLAHDTVRTAAGRAGFYIDGTFVTGPTRFGQAIANTVLSVALCNRSNLSYAAGAHTIDLRMRVENAADTTTITSVVMTAMALPN